MARPIRGVRLQIALVCLVLGVGITAGFGSAVGSPSSGDEQQTTTLEQSPDKAGEGDQGQTGGANDTPSDGQGDGQDEEAVKPDTKITAGPPENTDSSEATFEFESSESDSTFECRLDDGSWEECESPQSYSELADGSHAFEVRATTDSGESDPEPPRYEWTIAAGAPDVAVTEPKEGEEVDPTPSLAGLAGSEEGDSESVTIRIFPGLRAGTGSEADRGPGADQDPGADGEPEANGKPDAGKKPDADGPEADKKPGGDTEPGAEREPATEPVQTVSATVEDGRWKTSVAEPLLSGHYTIEVEQTDAAGNTVTSDPTTFTVVAGGELRTQDFSSNPNWDSMNNRSSLTCAVRYQNFGYSPTTRYASGKSGEIGGTFKRSLLRSRYAKDIGARDLSQSLRSSGMLSLPADSATTPQRDGSNVLIGWFNSSDSHFWRMSNSIVIRLDGFTNGRANVSAAYGTDHWLSDSKDLSMQLQLGKRYSWNLDYDPPPQGQNGWGEVRLKIGSKTLRVPLTEQAYKDGASFDRFGMLSHTLGNGPTRDRNANTMTAFVDNLSLNGSSQGFSSTTDPNWNGDGNRTNGGDDCESVRARNDFGFSNTGHAGSPGELGGRIWRTEIDDSGGLAYYADPVGDLDLSQPLQMEGDLALKEGYVDAGLFLGWFNAQDSRDDSTHHQPTNFLGLGFGGLSRLGWWTGPTWRSNGDAEDRLDQSQTPPTGPFPIYPDGGRHHFKLSYLPGDCTTGNEGEITMSLGSQDTAPLKVDPCVQANFNRFGLRVARPGGQSLLVYFDNLTYTAAPSLAQTQTQAEPNQSEGGAGERTDTEPTPTGSTPTQGAPVTTDTGGGSD